MKTKITALAILFALVFGNLTVFAQSATSSRSNAGGNSGNARIDNLDRLMDRIDDMRRLTASQKSAIKANIQTEIDRLKAATTTQSRVQNLLEPQVAILSAADRVDTLLGMFQIMYTKLQTRITTVASTSQAEMQESLSDINSRMTLISASSTAMQSTVLNLRFDQGSQAEMQSNLRTLRTARNELMAIRRQLTAIRNDMKDIVDELDELYPAEDVAATSSPSSL